MRLLFACLVCLTALYAPPLSAQAADAARSASARALFEEGIKSADAAEWAEAADRFQRALTLRDSQVIRYNLAAALSELGRLVEASELLRKVAGDPAVDAGLREDAQSKLARVSARIGKLTVELDPPDAEVTVVLDEHPLARAMVGVAIPTDPGEHSLRALRGEEEVDARQITLAAGAAQSVTLATKRVATPSEAAATLVSAPVAEPVSNPDHRVGGRSKLLWWGVGAGVVAAVAIAVVSALAISGSNDSGSDPYQGDFDPPYVPVKVQP